MASERFLEMSPEQWAGVTALATVVLVVVTAGYAWLTHKAVKAAGRSADAAERSATASTRAAQAAEAAAGGALRQAEAMERAELVNTMPMVYAIVRGVDSNSDPPEFTVQIGNSGRGTAINVRLRMLEGQLPGPTIAVRQPILPASTSSQEEKLGYPVSGANLQSPYIVEALYQNNQGREFASQSHRDGRVGYYLVARDSPGSTPRYEPLIEAPLPGP
jgi:hypothetical protein